ncbi:acyltransferase [Aquabacterium sp. A7-Y]|uniref:acyltransferase n=1 Tax=Aquabacterium sp. A7-Y TaxID=1349605 RepID=UPI00223DDF71|nr:acyltransferase [Aquabacterium sp. A7-Y]MCW7541784.1 acyltransferase [Aquabacterium sp. A7-Y]
MFKSLVLRLLRCLTRPRLIYGWRRHDGTWLPHTRISTATDVQGAEGLYVEDHVFIGHFNLLDAAGGLHIGEGTQVSNHVSLLTHSSHVSTRLMGRAYWGAAHPVGVKRGATHIGPYCFIGANSVVMPGSRLGRGVLVRAFSYVDGDFPDYAVIGGQPARILGDVRDFDAAWIERYPDLAPHYCGIGWQSATVLHDGDAAASRPGGRR